MARRPRKTLVVLSFTLVVVTLGYGLVVPLLPFYIEALGGRGGEMGALIALSALTELLFGPVWGQVSDRVGRKRVLMIGIFGYGVSLLLMGVASRLWMLFAARALSGLLTAATTPSAMAYVGDSTTEEERGGGIGWLGSAAGLGIVLGPGVGGWLGRESLSLPFFAGAGLAWLALLLVWRFLPETLPVKEAEDRDRTRVLQPLRLWEALFSSIGFPLFLLFLVSFGLANFEAVFGLYGAEKFGFGPERVGGILMVVGLVTTLGKGALTGPLTRRWGEKPVIKASLLAGAAGYLALLAAFDYLTVLLATGVFILSKTVLRPALLALISRRAGAGQGTAMGLGNTFLSLGRVIGPLWAGFIFDVNLSLPYLSGAAIMAAGFVLSLRWLVGRRSPESYPGPSG
ncbi:MAG: MFS transporter [Anaerolineae bacterium]|nr:MFS transporter [Anaerolineae bacterium]